MVVSQGIFLPFSLDAKKMAERAMTTLIKTQQ
jgi:hypothetical protein